MSSIETVGIIGAGQIGSGIAHVSALAGYNVLLYDISPDRIELYGVRHRQRQHGAANSASGKAFR